MIEVFLPRLKIPEYRGIFSSHLSSDAEFVSPIPAASRRFFFDSLITLWCVMNVCIVRVLPFFFLLILIQPLSSWGSDLDDGISKYGDDPISKYDELGKKERNVIYVKMKAKSKANVQTRAKMRQNQGSLAKNSNSRSSDSDGSSSINSVLIGAGGVVKGDIIIIDESRGDKTLISE